MKWSRSGWSGSWTAGTQFDYDNGVSPVPNGSWVLENLQPGSADVNATRILSSAVTSGRFVFYFRHTSLTRDNFNVQMQSGATRGQDISFGSITAGYGGTTGRALADGINSFILIDMFAVDRWYKIMVDFDCTTDTSSIYVDDVLVRVGARFNTNIASIDRVVFRNPNGGTGAYPTSFYFDSLGPYSALPATATSTTIYGATINGATIY